MYCLLLVAVARAPHRAAWPWVACRTGRVQPLSAYLRYWMAKSAALLLNARSVNGKTMEKLAAAGRNVSRDARAHTLVRPRLAAVACCGGAPWALQGSRTN